MTDIMTRKCAKCKGEIEIDVNDIRDVVYFDKSYYHKDCFRELAQQKASNKRCSAKWQETLSDDLKQVSQNANYIINYCYGRDLLFEHLLNSYDICALSSYIKMALDNVVAGKYKGKSKPIPYRDLAICWIDGQRALDKIYINNKQIGKDMSGDQRLIYDLAIVVNRFPKWKNLKVKSEKAKQELVNMVSFDDIDMSKIGHGKQEKKKDISDISDDIFVE